MRVVKFQFVYRVLLNDKLDQIAGACNQVTIKDKLSFVPLGYIYRHSSIYAVNVETEKKNRRSKNRVNQGYLVVLKGRKIE